MTGAISSPSRRVGESLRSRLSMKDRRRLARWRLASRRPTSLLRDLPDVLIVGAQRCGTSSLYKYLGEHPLVIPSIRKETDFFSTRYAEGEAWYRSHFPFRFRPRQISFEATPDYLLHPLAAERAARLVPDARIIVMLRDPVDRALSQYLHNKRLGLETLTFEEALEREPERIAGEFERLQDDPHYRAISLRRFGYAERGKYDQQLRRWWDRFPAEHRFVVRSEDFFTAPDRVFAEVIRFLELPPFEPLDFRNYSLRGDAAGVQGPPQIELDPSTRQRLSQVLLPHSRDLAALIGRDFGWFKQPRA